MAKTITVSLQVQNLILKQSSFDYTLDFQKYEEETIESICHPLDKLKTECFDFDKFSEQACYCALSPPALQAYAYDRKYLLYENDSLKPVFRLVVAAYEEYYWEELMEMCRLFGVSNSQHL